MGTFMESVTIILLVADIKAGRIPKKGMIFVNRLEDLMEIEDFLNSQLGHL